MSGPPASADHLLAIDVGTQSVRALVFDAVGTVIAMARIPIEPYVSPHPGWAEQDPELYWRSIGEACRRVLAEPAVRRDAIAGLALTTQRGTVVVTDEAGAPLRPAIVWLDQRRTPGLPPIGGLNGLAFRALGVRDTVAAFGADGEANWIRANEPETWGAIRHYLLLSGFLTHRLTGRFVDSNASQVGYLPFDFKRFRWADDGDWKWQVAPVDRAWLPELVPPTGPLGELTPAAAEATGTPGRAAGASPRPPTRPARCWVPVRSPRMSAGLSYGTTATVNTTHRALRRGDPARSALSGGHPRARTGWRSRSTAATGWSSGSSGSSGTTRWREAAARGIAPEVLFDELVGSRARRLDGPDAPAVLVARRPDPRTRGEGRHHRVRGRPHPGAPLPGDPRGAGVRPARGCGADRDADRRPADVSCAWPAAGRRARRPCS